MSSIKTTLIRHKQLLVISVAAIAIASYMIPIGKFSPVLASVGGSTGKYGGHFPGGGATGGKFPGGGATGGEFPGRGHGVTDKFDNRDKTTTNDEKASTTAKSNGEGNDNPGKKVSSKAKSNGEGNDNPGKKVSSKAKSNGEGNDNPGKKVSSKARNRG
jgi:hypothetical protein